MSGVFSAAYAAAYDAIYCDKDYAAECDRLEELFRSCAAAGVRRVLDLGCGTGSHSLALAQRGYQVVGIDRSPAMLSRARAKRAPRLAGRAEFLCADIRRLALSQRFDAALMMFAVLGYLGDEDAVAEALAATRRHLEPGGLFAFDVWYAPAVLRIGPSERVRRVEGSAGPLSRRARGELHPQRRLCRVVVELCDPQGDAPTVREIHEVRYFSADELRRLLSAAGFAPLRLGAFPEYQREPDETTWSVLVAARAV